MFTLHLLGGEADDLALGTVSIGILDPNPPGASLEVYDFGLQRVVRLAPESIVALAEGEPARVSFAARPNVLPAPQRMVANRAKVLRFPRKEKAQVDDNFISGYDRFARPAALYWRQEGVGSQPLLAAGVFALSSIQTSIKAALRLFEGLGPYVLEDKLPSTAEMKRVVKRSGAGLTSSRPVWFEQYSSYRFVIADLIDEGLRDDKLRRMLATEHSMPKGLGLAKLSFTLALVGNDCGCLDARILDWAFSPKVRERFNKAMSRKRSDGTFAEVNYQRYRSAELSILRDTPFYDPDDPVGLARAQWMLWESLGPEDARTHTHEEMFRAVLEPAWRM